MTGVANEILEMPTKTEWKLSYARPIDALNVKNWLFES